MHMALMHVHAWPPKYLNLKDILLLGTVKFLAEELKYSSEITGLSLAQSKLLFTVTLLNI